MAGRLWPFWLSSSNSMSNVDAIAAKHKMISCFANFWPGHCLEPPPKGIHAPDRPFHGESGDLILSLRKGIHTCSHVVGIFKSQGPAGRVIRVLKESLVPHKTGLGVKILRNCQQHRRYSRASCPCARRGHLQRSNCLWGFSNPQDRGLREQRYAA